MKILGISFTHKKTNSSTDFLVKKALEYAEINGAEIEFVKITDYNIKPCTGCGMCMNNRPCPLLSDKTDDAKKLYKKVYEADRFIFGFPIYALALPAYMINFFDRAPYVDDQDLTFDRYTYERCEIIKGKCFKGKVAALIGVATGLGHDAAMGNLFPAFTAMKLTTCVSVGLSLMEYDSQPQVRKHPWAKNIEEADFALQMMEALGKRIVTASSAFITEKVVQKNSETQICQNKRKKLSSFKLQDLDGKEYSSEIFNHKKNIFIIGRGPDSRIQCDEWHAVLKSAYKDSKKIELIRLVSVSCENLPSFITPEFIKAQVKAFNQFPDDLLFFDWENIVIHNFGMTEGDFSPNIFVIDEKLNILGQVNGLFSKEKLEFISKIIDQKNKIIGVK